VINRIAAGEVVVRPSAALKELLENSIDAGSQNITVGCREGGLQTMQIQDDGHGIKVEDYPILCERFTTSKIEKYQDLKHVASFGFRGEALASISFVGKLEITSRTADQDVAYKGYFENGILVPSIGDGSAAPIECAGHIGTLIKANDLFYNNTARKKCLNKKEEFMHIIEVVMNYATHFCKVNFILKALESNNIAVSTVTISKANRTENEIRKESIRRLYGGVKEHDLFDIQHAFSCFNIQINAVCTKANSRSNTIKRNTMILFINNRLVKCEPIKKAIDAAYNPYLPKGN
jgi:DNA mismatch repair protein MLH1